MQPDLAAGRRDTTHRAHQRIDAGRQAFANVWSRISGRLEPSDDAGDAQAPQNMAEDHRSDDIAASGVEKNDPPQPRVGASGLEEIDKGQRGLGLDNAISHDDVGTMPTALARFQRRDMETHWGAMLLSRSLRHSDPRQRERGDQH